MLQREGASDIDDLLEALGLTFDADHICLPPSGVPGLPDQFASGFGTIAERLIEIDFLETAGFAPGQVYIDNNNLNAYRQFIRARNPGVNEIILLAGTALARPDLLADNGVLREYYEIKPLSVSGAAEGLGKLVRISTFMTSAQLPYVPGTTYGDRTIQIGQFDINGFTIGASLKVVRIVPGLLNYVLCLDGDLAEVLQKMRLAALLLLLMRLLMGAKSPGGAPVPVETTASGDEPSPQGEPSPQAAA